MNALSLCLFCLIVLGSPVCCLSQPCDNARAEFEKISKELVFGPSTVKSHKTSATTELTNQAVALIRSRLLDALDTSAQDPAARAIAYLKCAQDLPAYAGWENIVDAPTATYLDDAKQTAMVTYILYRGPYPAGVPDTIPFADFFARGDHGWRLIGSAGSNFQASTFHFHSVTSPVAGQNWFLLSGFHIGDTGTRLSLELIAFDGRQVRTVSAISGLTQTTVDQYLGNSIVLRKYKGFANGHDIFERTQWKVATDGLKPEKSLDEGRQLTK